MASSDFSKDIRSRISADRALCRPLRWPSEPPISRDLDRSLTSPSLRAVAVNAEDGEGGPTRYPPPLLPSPTRRGLGHPNARAAQCLARPCLRRHIAFPFWYGPQIRLIPAGAWMLCRIAARTQVAPRLGSQATELRVVARGRTLHLPDEMSLDPHFSDTHASTPSMHHAAATSNHRPPPWP